MEAVNADVLERLYVTSIHEEVFRFIYYVHYILYITMRLYYIARSSLSHISVNWCNVLSYGANLNFKVHVIFPDSQLILYTSFSKDLHVINQRYKLIFSPCAYKIPYLHTESSMFWRAIHQCNIIYGNDMSYIFL